MQDLSHAKKDIFPIAEKCMLQKETEAKAIDAVGWDKTRNPCIRH